MAIVHLKTYYNEIETQYIQALKDYKELEEEVKKGNFPQENLVALSQGLVNIRNMYMILSNVMFLLNQPKSRKHNKRILNNEVIQSLLNESNLTPKQVIDENTNVLVNFEKVLSEVKKNND